MAKPKHIDLTQGGVITQEALLAYAEGRLSDVERAEIDRLLQSDPFAQDALEGLRTSAHAGEITTVITSINTKLREKTGLRERKKKGIQIHWANYAYAAVILGVLIGVGFVLIEIFAQRNNQQAMNKPTPKEVVNPPAKEKDNRELISKNATDTAVSEKKDSVPINEQTTPASTTVNTPATTGASTQTEAVSQKIKDAESTSKPSPAQDVKANAKDKLTTDQTISMLSAAKAYFESGDYVNAEKKYAEILAIQPDNTDALYFGGVSAYLNGSKGMGETNFDKLNKQGQYPEGAKWYKANILIRKGKKEEAKQLLRELAASNGYFKERAVKKYEELYK